jgi:hypothetical protein
VYPKLSVSLDCPFLIDPSVFSSVYIHTPSCSVHVVLYTAVKRWFSEKRCTTCELVGWLYYEADIYPRPKIVQRFMSLVLLKQHYLKVDEKFWLPTAVYKTTWTEQLGVCI